MPRRVTAIDIANSYRLNQKDYRRDLRKQARHDPRLSGHAHYARWVVEEGSPAYDAMIEVAKKLAGVPQNDAEAVKWCGPAADQGHAEHQYDLGIMYRDGDGVPQNNAEAVKWFRLAADQGDADAQTNLGFMYAQGQGVPQDYSEAVKWYRLAADQGQTEAQQDLGVMYAEGQGVPQDYAEAMKWYRVHGEFVNYAAIGIWNRPRQWCRQA